MKSYWYVSRPEYTERYIVIEDKDMFTFVAVLYGVELPKVFNEKERAIRIWKRSEFLNRWTTIKQADKLTILALL